MKRLALSFVVLLTILAMIVFLWDTNSTDPVNSANYHRIEIGMRQAQVEQILGVPGEEGNGDGLRFPISWQGSGRNVITVDFSFEGQACVVGGKRFFNPGLWDRVKEWWGGYELFPDGSKRLAPAA